jgi:hypothetical protein
VFEGTVEARLDLEREEGVQRYMVRGRPALGEDEHVADDDDDEDEDEEETKDGDEEQEERKDDGDDDDDDDDDDDAQRGRAGAGRGRGGKRLRGPATSRFRVMPSFSRDRILALLRPTARAPPGTPTPGWAASAASASAVSGPSSARAHRRPSGGGGEPAAARQRTR